MKTFGAENGIANSNLQNGKKLFHEKHQYNRKVSLLVNLQKKRAFKSKIYSYLRHKVLFILFQLPASTQMSDQNKRLIVPFCSSFFKSCRWYWTINETHISNLFRIYLSSYMNKQKQAEFKTLATNHPKELRRRLKITRSITVWCINCWKCTLLFQCSEKKRAAPERGLCKCVATFFVPT